jgi:hypothetical protein
MVPMETNEIFKKFQEKFSEAAIQRTNGSETRKGYNTTGYGYQWIVDRLNDVLFDQWGFEWEIIHSEKGNYQSGGSYYDITVRVGIWIISKDNIRHCVGGHMARLHGDALKGAITNGIKKTAAFWGIGADAFRGDLDDDHSPIPNAQDNQSVQTQKWPTFEEIKIKISNMNISEMKVYWTELMTAYSWSEKQKNALTSIFQNAKSEINQETYEAANLL